MNRIPFFEPLKEDNVRKGYFEHEDFLNFRKHLPEEIQPIATFAYFTGCRKGEILLLRWEQIDLERAVVRLEPGETKNDEARLIPLVPELREILAAQKDRRDQICPVCPWVFFPK